MPGQLGLIALGTGVVDYDGRRFTPAAGVGVGGGADLEGGGAGREAGPAVPVGVYHQRGDLVWAEFSGPAVLAGRLVGTCRADGTIDAAYCYVKADGDTVAGTCVSVPDLLADGRIRLTEHWRRFDGAAGVSHIEELPG